jgi:hypothetical protein
MHDSPEIEGRGTVDRLFDERQRGDMMLSIGDDMIIRLLLVGFNSPSVGARSSSPVSYDFLSLLSTIKCCMCINVCPESISFSRLPRSSADTPLDKALLFPLRLTVAHSVLDPLRGRKSHHGRFPSPGDEIKLLPAMPEIDYGHLRDQALALAGANTVSMCEFQNSSVAFERGSRGQSQVATTVRCNVNW